MCIRDRPLSHALIKSYHFRFKSGVFEDLANGYAVGEYKTRANIVGNIVTASPKDCLLYTSFDNVAEEGRLSAYESSHLCTIFKS